MSLADQIRAKKSRLKHTKTLVRTITGVTLEEDSQNSETRIFSSDSSLPQGYVVDDKPDLELAKIFSTKLLSVYIGSQDAAAHLDGLLAAKITHILNVGYDIPCFFPEQFEYKVVPLLDTPETNLLAHLHECIEFIKGDEVNSQRSILIHCNAGISRAVSVAIGFLILEGGLNFESALAQIRLSRPAARPNDGFTRQLKAMNT